MDNEQIEIRTQQNGWARMYALDSAGNRIASVDFRSNKLNAGHLKKMMPYAMLDTHLYRAKTELETLFRAWEEQQIEMAAQMPTQERARSMSI